MAKKLATPWQRAIGKKLLTRCAAVAKMLPAEGAAVAKMLPAEGAAVAKMLLVGAPGGRYLIQQRRHVQKAFLQRSNC